MCIADLCSVREPLPALVSFPVAPDDRRAPSVERADVQDVMAFRLREWRRDQYSEPPLFLCSADVLTSDCGSWPLRADHREYYRVLRGRMRIEDPHARSWEFAAGQSFMLLRGFVGTIYVIEPVQSVHVIFALPSQTALDWCRALKVRTGLGQSESACAPAAHADSRVEPASIKK